MNPWWFAGLLAVVACHHASQPLEADATPDGSADAAASLVATSTQLCKLLSARNTSDPTANDVQHRSNMLGADLGIPVDYNDTLFLFFGDTMGYAVIWSAGESHPDAIGFGGDSAAAIAIDPELLCDDLGIVSLDPAQSIGPHVDSSVMADFAAGSMSPATGHSLGDFIHNPAGSAAMTLFPNLPGDFEVPSGAFAADGSIFLFYTTVASPQDPEMTASYLARWVNPSSAGPPAYQILYLVDERGDANGPLQGHFINVAAQVYGDYVYLFGTGEYRNSAIYLARKRLDALGTPGGFEELGTMVATVGYGEVSARYFSEIDRWVVLAEESTAISNRIVAYLSQSPEGPWSAPIIIHDMADAQFRAKYCCAVDDDCEGPQMFNCDKTGFYGTYLLPSVTTAGSGFSITYTMSSFSPYNVALFQTTLSGS